MKSSDLNGVKLTPGDMTLIAPAKGSGKFIHNGKTWLRNGTIVPDNADLDPVLFDKKEYVPSGGQDTFNRRLGSLVATTRDNPNGTVVIFETASGIAWKSVNGGVDFAGLSLPSFTFSTSQRDSSAISPTTGTIIACVNAANNSGRLRRSTDYWETSNIVGHNYGTNLRPAAVFCASNGDWYAGDNSGTTIHKSTDDGVTWNTTGNTGLNDAISSITEGDNGRILVATVGSRLIYTDNEGSSWTSATGVSSQNSNITYLGKRGNDAILLLTSEGIIQQRISINNGTSWKNWDLINDIALINGSFSSWSDGNGKLVIGVAQYNYDGGLDRTAWYVSNDYGDTISLIGYSASDRVVGLVEGANNRLHAAAVNYDAVNSKESYVYFDIGYSSGGRIEEIEHATLIKAGV